MPDDQRKSYTKPRLTRLGLLNLAAPRSHLAFVPIDTPQRLETLVQSCAQHQ